MYCQGQVTGRKRAMGNTWGLNPSVFIACDVPKPLAPHPLVEMFTFRLCCSWQRSGSYCVETRAFQQHVNLSKYFKMDIYSDRNG